MLERENVALRAIEESDLQQLLLWRNNPDLRKFFREFRELNMMQQGEWYNHIVCKSQNEYMFAIHDMSIDKLIGCCGCVYINWVHRSCDFSIYIGDEGVYIDSRAYLAGQLLIDYAFNTLNLKRIWTEIYDFDYMKKEFLEKLNFRVEGTFKSSNFHNGKYHDSWLYALVK